MDTGCTIFILHHQGKGNQRDDRFLGRGSSAIFEAAGSAFQLEVSGDYPDKVYRLWQTKTRMGFFGEARYQLHDVGGHVEEIDCTEGIALVPSIELHKKQSIEDKIVDALRANGELAAEELSKTVGGRKQDVVKVRDAMVEDDLIDAKHREGDGRKVYFLTDVGKAWGGSGA